MIRIPLRLALIGVVLALIIGVVGAPIVWPPLAIGANEALAQEAPTTTTPSPSQTPIVVTATPPPPSQTPVVVTATAAPPTATPLPPGWVPDSCHPNHALHQPCALPTESEVANLNFVGGATDVYSFLLKGGRQYRISATVASDGLDPSIVVYAAGADETPLAQNDDAQIGNPSAAVTMTVEHDAWYLVAVTNTAPGDMRGKTYAVSARSSALPTSNLTAPAGAGSAATATTDDLIGNAYDVLHAARIVWAAPYDLSMLCPDPRPGACYAGRHTFLLVNVKAGIPFAALTYDLGGGVDTVLTLYKPDPNQTVEAPGVIPGWRAIAANDDFVAGITLRSQVRITPDWNGELLIVVAPSARQDLPPAPQDSRPGRYRLIVGPPDMKPVAAAIAAQGDMPTPQPAQMADAGASAPSAPAPAPAAPAPAPAVPESSVTGIAELIQEAELYGQVPPSADDELASYPAGTRVKLLGQGFRGWVKVQPADAVMVGWMWGPSLKAVEVEGGLRAPTSVATGPTPNISSPGEPANVSPTAEAAAPTAVSGSRAATIEQLDPESLPVDVVDRPIARALRIEVCTATAENAKACGQPLARLRVEVRLASTMAVQVQGMTEADGTLTLSTSVPSGTRLVLTIPALGIQSDIANEATELPVRVPATLGGSQ